MNVFTVILAIVVALVALYAIYRSVSTFVKTKRDREQGKETERLVSASAWYDLAGASFMMASLAAGLDSSRSMMFLSVGCAFVCVASAQRVKGQDKSKFSDRK